MSDIYKNKEGVYIRVTTDKNGKTHVDFTITIQKKHIVQHILISIRIAKRGQLYKKIVMEKKLQQVLVAI